MVVNLCLPHFHTTAHCNKLCADGYDVTNLVSADPALRRRGFKLEYFLRPPLQVTLKFGFQVELCRIDVELWSWGMDRGQACKRLEISTSSDPRPPTDQKQIAQKDQKKMQLKDQKAKNRLKHQRDGYTSQQSNGQKWSFQAQQWGEEAADDPQQTSHVLKCQSNTECSDAEPEFKLVARCELTEETRLCFRHSNFRPRAPFLSPPPPQPANSRQEELWSRGLPSLGAVTQLRVTMPLGGAASSLGLKALAVWGQPARCCPTEEVERIVGIHKATERQLSRPVFFAPSVRQTSQPPQAPPSVSIPEEFLDPITQEVMTLPMLLPSGVSVDNSTLDEHQKREATWGRPPNDPFTGVPFSSTSQPLPNPQLKSRIDHFLLQKGMTKRDGIVGRQDQGDYPQASRLVTSSIHGQSQNSPCLSKGSMNSNCVQSNSDNRDSNKISDQMQDSGSGPSSSCGNRTPDAQPLCTESKPELDRGKKRDASEISRETTDVSTTKKLLRPQTKRPRTDLVSAPSCSTHEQRLSASLDEALLSALKGRPSFTSNLPQQREVVSNSSPLSNPVQSKSSSISDASAGGKVCSACSRSVSAYSTSAPSIYRLICGHLLCRPCLQEESKRPDWDVTATSGPFLCPTCQMPTPRGRIIRVHH
ncbi:RING finger protein 37 [Leuresthes tenuis]|uniref:RING finger protein 37 n=1 Tax=Leuresthes tenuis TaxID=355514 RepID=UPI003B503E6A